MAIKVERAINERIADGITKQEKEEIVESTGRKVSKKEAKAGKKLKGQIDALMEFIKRMYRGEV